MQKQCFPSLWLRLRRGASSLTFDSEPERSFVGATSESWCKAHPAEAVASTFMRISTFTEIFSPNASPERISSLSQFFSEFSK